jgi:UDP-N-acetylmuramyl tripeptide synthase
VVLNLFRDQLDRYGELDATATLIGRGIAAAGKTQLYLNADDPLVASLASYAADKKQVSYFGIADAPIAKLDHDVTADSDNCPICGRALVYTKSFYGHIGHYRCKQGHFNRPEPDLLGDSIKLQPDHASLKLKTVKAGGGSSVTIKLPGIYNVYNALAAALMAEGMEIDLDVATASLERVEAAYGRVEAIALPGNKQLYLLLVKNPTGFNQVLQTFLLNKKQQQVLLAINDNFADGRDVSWLWDVAFEELQTGDHLISATGLRASDMALRLKYADMTTIITNPNIAKSLNQFIDQIPAGQIGYVIPTYTAMLEIRRQLGRKTALAGVWE